MSSEVWTARTKNLWFYGALTISAALMVYLFSPYLMVLLFAAVVVVVSWPIYAWIRQKVRGRAMLASVLTTLLLALVFFGPLSLLAWLFVSEAAESYAALSKFLGEGTLETWLRNLEEQYNSPQIQELVDQFLPPDFDPVGAVIGPLQQAATAVLNVGASVVPELISATVTTILDAILFVFAVVTLYVEGPRLLVVAMRLSPMDDAYELRLFQVFRRFANNMVLGSLATAIAQGVLAALCFGIAGVDRLVFLGILTAVFSFVPMVGSAFVWVPVAVVVGMSSGWGWAVFVAVWSLGVTGTADNLIKPLFLRGGTNIHPLLIFLAVFGGIMWMGVPGALVGPVIVAFFLALYTIYLRDFLGVDPKDDGTAAFFGGGVAEE